MSEPKKPSIPAIDALIDDYVEGRRSFRAFWQAFMTTYVEGQHSPLALAAYESVYDAVYMGTGSVVSAEERGVGLIGDDDLKAWLRQFRRTQLVT